MKRQGLSICILIICLFAVQAARACSCDVLPPPREALLEADAVFLGKVVRTLRDAEDINEGSLFATFVVTKVWKGNVAEEVVVRTAPNSALCGVGFQEDQEYIVYAVIHEGQFETHLCTRTALAQHAQLDMQSLGEPVVQFEIPDDVKKGRCGDSIAVLQAVLFVLIGLSFFRARPTG